LDRAFGYEPKGRRFESFRAHHRFNNLAQKNRNIIPTLSTNSLSGQDHLHNFAICFLLCLHTCAAIDIHGR
jgi:hypothetical protein